MSTPRFLRVAVLFLAGAVCVLGLLLAALHLPPVRRYVQGQLERLARRDAQVALRISGLNYNLLTGWFEVRGLNVTRIEPANLPAVITASRIQGRLAMRDLLHGRIVIDGLDANQLAVHLLFTQAGTSNIPSFSAPNSSTATPTPAVAGPEPLLPAFLIRRLAADGSLIVEDQASALDLRLPAWTLNITGNALTYVHRAVFEEVQAGQVRLQGRELPVEAVRLDATVSRERQARLSQFLVEAGGSRITVTGSTAGFTAPVLDLSAQARLALAPLTRFVGRPQAASGILEADVRATGKASAPDASVHLSGGNLTAAPSAALRLDRLNIDARARWLGSERRLEVQQASLRAPQGNLTAEGVWNGTAAGANNRATGSVGSLDAGQISRLLKLPVEVATLVDGTFEARWRGVNFAQAGAIARLQLRPSQNRVAKNVLPLGGTVTLASEDQRISVVASNVTGMGAAISTDVKLDLRPLPGAPLRGDLSGTVRGQVDRIGTLAADWNAFQGQTATASIQGQPVSGNARISLNLGGTLQQPTASVIADGSNLGYGPVTDAGLRIEAGYTPSELTVRQAAIAWRGSEVTASGRVGLAGPSRPLNLTANFRGLSVPLLLDTAGLPLPAQGMLSGNLDAQRTLEDPRVSIELNGQNLAAYDRPLGTLATRASYAGRAIRLESFRLNRPEDLGSLTASGSFQLDSRDYSVQLDGTKLRIKPGRAGGTEIPAGGVVNLSVKGQGNLDNPAAEVSVDVEGASARGKDLGALSIRAHLADHNAEASMQAPRFRLSGDVQANTNAPYPVSLRLTADGTDLSTLPIEAPAAALQGSLTGQLTANGNVQDWKDAEAMLDLSNLRVVQNGVEIASDGPLSVAYRGRSLQVLRARLLGPKSSLSLQGELPVEAGGTPGVLQYQGQMDLDALSSFTAPDSGITSGGELTLEGMLRGSLAKLEPSGSVAVHDGRVASKALKAPLDSIELKASFDNREVSIEQMQATLGTGKLSAQGTVPLGIFPLPNFIAIVKSPQPARFKLEATGITLGSVLDLPEDVNGNISLRLDAQAAKPDLNSVTASLTVSPLTLNVRGVQVTQPEPALISLKNGLVTVDRFALSAPGSELHLSGFTALRDGELHDVRLSGTINAGLLQNVAGGLGTAGTLTLRVDATGRLTSPVFSGFVEMADGRVALAQPQVDLSNLNFRIALEQQRLRIEQFKGDLNGGTLALSGSLDLAQRIQPTIEAKATDVYLEFPQGLRTQSNFDLNLRSSGEFLVLGGKVDLEQGSYTDTLDVQTLIRQYVQSSGRVELAGERNPMLSRLRFDIAVATVQPLVLDNNLGKLVLDADLRMLGTYYRPGLSGRIGIEEGGTLRLQENDYTIEQGNIDFVNEAAIQPLINITADTKVAGRTITMHLTNGTEGLSVDLSSDNPSDTRPDIIALLLTGQTADKLQGGGLNLAGENVALSLVAGSVSARAARELQNTLGLSQVRIDPTLISPESDPSARLTLGQDFTQQLNLIYSMNLTNSQDQIWIVNYTPLKRLHTSAVRQSDSSYRFNAQHDLQFGRRAGEQRKPPPKKTVGTVDFEGDLQFPREQLARKFRVDQGDKYDFFKVQKGQDRIESLYKDQGYLEARIHLRRDTKDDQVNLRFEIQAGPRVEFAYENWSPSRGLRKRVREIWLRGVFDQQRAGGSEAAIRESLARHGYLKPQVEYMIRPPEDHLKRVIFTVDQGTRYHRVGVVLEGASQIKPKELRKALDKAKLTDKVESEPAEVSNFLTLYYRQKGFLDAKVSRPELELDPQTARGQIKIGIQEGPRYKLGSIAFTGVTAFKPEELQKISGIKKGALYTPVLAQKSHDKVEEAYWRKGFRDVVIDYTLERNPELGQVNLVAAVTENRKSVVESVKVEGQDRTSASFIRKQIELKPGDPLDYTKTARSRQNLYNTGAFRSVDIQPEPVSGGQAITDQLKHVELLTKVQETVPFEFRYGGYYDTDRGPGFVADFWNRNSLGGGRTIGFSARYDSEIHDLRTFFSQPLVRGLPLRIDTTFYLRRELMSTFITDRRGMSIQQEARLRHKFILTYGYRFEHTHTYDTDQNAFLPFDEVLRTSPLTSTLTRDSRDGALDATHGSFTSQSFEFSSDKLGSSLNYFKYFGQYFKYVPLGQPRPIPFGRGFEKPRLIYAGGVRVGIAKGLNGQEIVPSERFFAGGGNTVRGFKPNTLGPVDILGDPAGGDAMLVINNEIRFPLFSIFDGVGFVDIGNVYPTVNDFSLTDVRKTGGAGLRVRTPYLLLRIDYGFKLDRKPGESPGALFFSVGQAF